MLFLLALAWTDTLGTANANADLPVWAPSCVRFPRRRHSHGSNRNKASVSGPLHLLRRLPHAPAPRLDASFHPPFSAAARRASSRWFPLLRRFLRVRTFALRLSAVATCAHRATRLETAAAEGMAAAAALVVRWTRRARTRGSLPFPLWKNTIKRRNRTHLKGNDPGLKGTSKRMGRRNQARTVSRRGKERVG